MERPRGTYGKAGRREGNHRNTRGAAMGRWQGGSQRAGDRGGGGQRGGRRGTTERRKDGGPPPARGALASTRQQSTYEGLMSDNMPPGD